jgi:hypothetical protein
MENTIKFSDDEYKKKYLKYKNKYIKTQLNKEEELVGGVFEDIYIYCPSEILETIKNLYPKENSRINDLNLFLFSLGPRSYNIKYGSKDTNNFFTGENFPNFWEFSEESPTFGTVITEEQRKKFYIAGPEVAVKKKTKDVEDYIKKKNSKNESFRNYKYFYLKNVVYSKTDYIVTIPED